MGYPLQQLQATALHIVNLYRYEDGQTLTRSEKKWATRELLQQLYNLSYIQKKQMLVDPSNQRLADYFDSLSLDKIVFPSDYRFMLKANGVSFEKHIISRLSFKEQAELVANKIANDCVNTRGPLNAFQQDFAQETIMEWLQEVKANQKGTIRIEAKNHGCDELLDELASQGVLFPAKTAYLMKPHGECLVQRGKHEELLYEPETRSSLFYEYQKSKKLRKRQRQQDLMAVEHSSFESSTCHSSASKTMLWQYPQHEKGDVAQQFAPNEKISKRLFHK